LLPRGIRFDCAALAELPCDMWEREVQIMERGSRGKEKLRKGVKVGVFGVVGAVCGVAVFYCFKEMHVLCSTVQSC
jgi:hypothetical protein